MIAVSVIIPVYNVEKFIERCARSLFSQTLTNMEFIFVDDCSQDNSVSVLENVLLDYPNRQKQVIIYKQKENTGSSRARNAGLTLAHGEFVTFCDSDDWVDLNMYESLYIQACKTDSDVVLCNFLMEYKNDSVRYETIKCDTSDKTKLVNEYIASVWTSLCIMIARRSVILKHQLALPIDITYCEDFHFMVRLMYYADKISKVDSFFYHYNQCNNSSIMQNCHLWLGVDDLKCYFSIIDFFKSQGVMKYFEKTMSWRVLNSIRLDVFHKEKHEKLKTIYPICHKYILSNPFYTGKEKAYMWLLTHHCRSLLLLIFKIRSLVNSLRD